MAFSAIVTKLLFGLIMTIICLWTPSTRADPITTGGSELSTFTAAVLEHKVIVLHDPTRVLTRREAVRFMDKNLKVYWKQAQIAKDKGAQIMVFPENGIYGYDFTRASLVPFLETIPEPANTTWIPCSDLQPRPKARTYVQRALSCIAKYNKLYVIANMADKVPCNTGLDPKCPKIGHYQYNTNVAYSPEGKLVAKYHKVHLWFEPYFDAAKARASFFDTPFARRVGLIICFDLLFGDPLITLVTKHNVKTIAYSTDFADILPIMAAMGFHSSVARGLGINVLAANIHDVQSHGSGIYTPYGAKTFYYDDRVSSHGRLLVSPVNASFHHRSSPVDASSFHQGRLTHDPRHKQMIDLPAMNEGNDDSFRNNMYEDAFEVKLLHGSTGNNINVCDKNVCCSLNYTRSEEQPDKTELYALGVFDGLHTDKARFYWQVCTLVKCASDNKTSCGWPTKISSTIFESLSLKGHFQAKYVYPQVVLSSTDGEEQLRLAGENAWRFRDNTVEWGAGAVKEPMLSVTMIGRIFDRDN